MTVKELKEILDRCDDDMNIDFGIQPYTKSYPTKHCGSLHLSNISKELNRVGFILMLDKA